MSELKFKQGQVVVANQDIELELASGEKEVIEKGSKAVVGFDRYMHHYNGKIQGFTDDVVIEGVSAGGLTQYLVDYLRTRLPLREMLEDYDLSEEVLGQTIFEAFEEIGLSED